MDIETKGYLKLSNSLQTFQLDIDLNDILSQIEKSPSAENIIIEVFIPPDLCFYDIPVKWEWA